VLEVRNVRAVARLSKRAGTPIWISARHPPGTSRSRRTRRGARRADWDRDNRALQADASINFGARQIVDYGFSIAISVNIDRVTGRMDATTVLSDPTKHPDPNTATIHFDVTCKASMV
jgi:hypothetical protein